MGGNIAGIALTKPRRPGFPCWHVSFLAMTTPDINFGIYLSKLGGWFGLSRSIYIYIYVIWVYHIVQVFIRFIVSLLLLLQKNISNNSPKWPIVPPCRSGIQVTPGIRCCPSNARGPPSLRRRSKPQKLARSMKKSGHWGGSPDFVQKDQGKLDWNQLEKMFKQLEALLHRKTLPRCVRVANRSI